MAARLRVPQWTRDMLPPHVPMAPFQTNTVLTCSFTNSVGVQKECVARKAVGGTANREHGWQQGSFFSGCAGRNREPRHAEQASRAHSSHHSAYCRLTTGKSTAVAPWRPTGRCAFGPNPVLRTRLGTALGISGSRNGAKWSGSPAPACESDTGLSSPARTATKQLFGST